MRVSSEHVTAEMPNINLSLPTRQQANITVLPTTIAESLKKAEEDGQKINTKCESYYCVAVAGF